MKTLAYKYVVLRACRGVLMVGTLSLWMSVAPAQQNSSVIGPANVELHDGAYALLAGDAEKGVALTTIGLSQALGRNERLTGMSNLCAGYLELGRLEEALEQCNKVLEEDSGHWRALLNRAAIYGVAGRFDDAEVDLALAEATAPASNVENVRNWLRDRRNPVEPMIIIDDRPQSAAEDIE